MRFAIFCLSALLFACGNHQPTKKKEKVNPRRVIIVMFDGFGETYYHSTPLPFLNAVERSGFYKQVSALMPTVTNCNNTAICTGEFPDVNGITGNTYLKPDGTEDYMESRTLIKAPTIFQKLQQLGLKSALIASKKKSISLLPAGTSLALSPETASAEWIKRIGTPAGIYSPEVNYWTMEAALYLVKNSPEYRCIYVHTTDYPMHMWAPEDPRSLAHVRKIDEYLKKLSDADPTAVIMVTADHDVKHKSRCVDIQRSLAGKGVEIRTAISAEKDKYVKHHRGFGGTSFVYLKQQGDAEKVTEALMQVHGVKTVLTREEAASEYHLMPERIGDLVVFADSMTVFGILPTASETLPDNYRSHGSEYELQVPLFIYNADKLPEASFFQFNKDIARWITLPEYRKYYFGMK